MQDKINNMTTVSDVVPYLLCGGHKAILSAYTGNNVPMYSYWSWLIGNYLCQFIPWFWYTLLINLPEIQIYLSTCERHQQTPRFHSILPFFTFSLQMSKFHAQSHRKSTTNTSPLEKKSYICLVWWFPSVLLVWGRRIARR